MKLFNSSPFAFIMFCDSKLFSLLVPRPCVFVLLFSFMVVLDGENLAQCQRHEFIVKGKTCSHFSFLRRDNMYEEGIDVLILSE